MMFVGLLLLLSAQLPIVASHECLKADHDFTGKEVEWPDQATSADDCMKKCVGKCKAFSYAEMFPNLGMCRLFASGFKWKKAKGVVAAPVLCPPKDTDPCEKKGKKYPDGCAHKCINEPQPGGGAKAKCVCPTGFEPSPRSGCYAASKEKLCKIAGCSANQNCVYDFGNDLEWWSPWVESKRYSTRVKCSSTPSQWGDTDPCEKKGKKYPDGCAYKCINEPQPGGGAKAKCVCPTGFEPSPRSGCYAASKEKLCKIAGCSANQYCVYDFGNDLEWWSPWVESKRYSTRVKCSSTPSQWGDEKAESMDKRKDDFAPEMTEETQA